MNAKWAIRLKIKRISKYVMIFCLIFLVILAAFTLYGDKVGNFVVVLKEDKVKISACLTKELEKDQSSHLTIPGVTNLQATTYDYISDTLATGTGIKHHEKGNYMAFSFYLMNRTDGAISYDMSVEVIDEKAGTGNKIYKPSDALRILILEEGELNADLEGNKSLKADGTVFAKKEADQQASDALAPAHYPEGKVVDFLDGRTIIKRQGIAFEENGVRKYTVVLWIEGYDVSCRDELLGSRLKMKMSIDAYENK